MRTSYFQGELDAHSTGTTVVGLRQPELLNCKLMCPDYAIQKKIATILQTIDDIIINNCRINDNLEA